MNTLEKNLAVARGEALAASLLASAALQAVFMFVLPQAREELCTRLNAFVDNTLNSIGSAEGSANEVDIFMLETARFQATQHLDEMARVFRGPLADG
jgi:hypothetical protein